MKVSLRASHLLLLIAGVYSGLMIFGCAPSSLGPQQPLLPTIEGSSKFSDRFELDEEPQFFYDLFGKELLEGNEVHQYVEEKEFDARGNLFIGRTGQLDADRFTAQLDRTILTQDNFRGRFTEFAIGDEMRIKPETLFPNRYIIYKTEFDGLRWDISFAQERHLFTLLNSRISNPVFASGSIGNTLGQTIGRRNGENEDGVRNIENTRLVGFRGQGMLGDVFRVGFTYLNLHKEHPERISNPMMGTVANTPPTRVVIAFRDDSPEDNHYAALLPVFDELGLSQGGVGVAVKQIEVYIKTQTVSEEGERGQIEEYEEYPIVISGSELVGNIPATLAGDEGPPPYLFGGRSAGEWAIAEGFDAIGYELNLLDLGISPRTVYSLEFVMEVAGDYNITVTGFSPQNVGDDTSEWIKAEDGRIEMPFRDVITAPGNYGQSTHYTDHRDEIADDPDSWEGDGAPRKVRYRYGAARAALLYGVDLEGTLWNTYIRAQYSINGKYKQYPTINKDEIGFSEIAKEEPDENDPLGRPASYADTTGEPFEAFLNGEPDGNGEMGREVAWFINLRQRFGRLHLEESFYHIDPGYTTTYRNFGANDSRDEPYSLPRTTEFNEQSPYDDGDYILIEDDDDNDDWPDDDDFDGVLPEADDRDQNGILDYQEDFLIFDADPPIFEDLLDLNNNDIVDALEDDYEPEYEYGIDRAGFHITADYEVLDNLTLAFGWLKENEVSSARQNNSKYFHLTYNRDIPDFGSIVFQNRFVRVRDDIPDYAITLRVGDLREAETNDLLDFYNARVNTSSLQFLYTAVPNLTLEAKLLVAIRKQYELDPEEKILLDDLATEDLIEQIDFAVPIDQVQTSGDRRSYAFYPDHELIYNPDNWDFRYYPEKNVRRQLTLLKGRYEIVLDNLPYFDKLGEGLTVTPMFKYVWERAFDRTSVDFVKAHHPAEGFAGFPEEERPVALNPVRILPTDSESVDYLRFNRRSREDAMGIRIDYQFTQRMSVLAGFQYRKFTNRDHAYEGYLDQFRWQVEEVTVPVEDQRPSDILLADRGEEVDVLRPIEQEIKTPVQYRPDQRTRIFHVQAINRGEWLGFNIVILAGFEHRTDVLKHTSSDTTFVRAMMGF